MAVKEDEMGIEHSVIKAFTEKLEKSAKGRRISTLALPLNSQDRKTGADFLLSVHDRFAFVEFKSYEKNIHDEKKKPLRLKMCKLLPSEYRMQSLHDGAHFIAWADRDLTIHINVYRHEVCNQAVFGSKGRLKQKLPNTAVRKLATTFIEEFLVGQNSLSLEDFETYLCWLLEDVAEKGKGSLVLLITDPAENRCGLLRFNSVEKLYEWIKEHKPEPAPSEESSMRREPGR